MIITSIRRPHKQMIYAILLFLSLGLTLLLSSCGTETVDQYEATAITTVTWRVNYVNAPNEDKRGRDREFASDSVENINGEKPVDGVVGPDDKGLWWPKIPPKPSVDEVEAGRDRPYEKIGNPELLRQVEYYITYQQNGQTITLPTNYSVYRQVVKASAEQTPLKLTLGINNGSVEKAEPVN